MSEISLLSLILCKNGDRQKEKHTGSGANMTVYAKRKDSKNTD